MTDQAIAALRNAARRDPDNDEYWGHWAASIGNITFMAVDDRLLDDLLSMLERPTVRPNDVLRAILSALRHHPDVAGLLAGRDCDDDGAADRLTRIPLLRRLMALSVVNDMAFETMLTGLRRAMLQAEAAGDLEAPDLPSAAALALQCFINQYAYWETVEETTAVEALGRRLAGLAQAGGDIAPESLAVVAAYRPLHGFAWAETLAGNPWPEPLEAVIAQQVTEPLEERAMTTDIPTLTVIEGGVSRDVRAQYEKNPYPRWVRTGLLDGTQSIAQYFRLTTLQSGPADYRSPANPDILVAGCGTGQHAPMTATRFRNARVTAVDLSRASLAYAQRKTMELGIANIEYSQGDILEMAELGWRFDVIECVGVLHHMDDPVAGWRVFAEALRPGGLMYIGLYSEAARRAVVEAREMIAERRYDASAEGIRRCRRDIMRAARNGDEAMAKIVGWRDFYSLSGCRDLLFHVAEQRFTIPRIEDALGQLDLEFLGFAVGDKLSMARRFIAANGGPGALASLSRWHRFERENPDAFSAMYQFWARKPG